MYAQLLINFQIESCDNNETVYFSLSAYENGGSLFYLLSASSDRVTFVATAHFPHIALNLDYLTRLRKHAIKWLDFVVFIVVVVVQSSSHSVHNGKILATLFICRKRRTKKICFPTILMRSTQFLLVFISSLNQ